MAISLKKIVISTQHIKKLFAIKDYYYDGYEYFAKIISEAAHHDIVLVIVYCCIYAMLFKYHALWVSCYQWITKFQGMKFMHVIDIIYCNSQLI